MVDEEDDCNLVADVTTEAVHPDEKDGAPPQDEAVHPDEKDGAPPQADALHTAHSTHLVDDVPVDVVPHHHTI